MQASEPQQQLYERNIALFKRRLAEGIKVNVTETERGHSKVESMLKVDLKGGEFRSTGFVVSLPIVIFHYHSLPSRIVFLYLQMSCSLSL